MKKFLVSFGTLIISFCLTELAEAKVAYVQEYMFNVLDVVPGESDTGNEKTGCPEEYPYPEEVRNTFVGEGIECKTDNREYDGTKCYSCTGPCNNTTLYPYTEEDCEGLSKIGECQLFNGKKRYKSCCPSGYYEAKDLTGEGKNSIFRYDTPLRNTAKTITCYKPLGCAGGKSPITEDDAGNFILKKEGSAYKATKRGVSCTSLTVLPVLKNQTSSNFYCASGYSCNDACKASSDEGSGLNQTCVKSLKRDTSLSSYYDTNCYYHPGCNTEDSRCFNYASVPPSINVSTSSEFDFWYYPANDRMDMKKRCIRYNGCVLEATNDHLYGPATTTVGLGISTEEQTLGEGTKQKKCYKYTCAEGWEGVSGDGTINVYNLQENGKYEVSYAQSEGKWFACRKDLTSLKVCYVNCSAGKWYNSTTQDCYTDEDTSSQVFVKKIGNRAFLSEFREYSNKKWSDLTGLDGSEFIAFTDAENIKEMLSKKYGVDHCFITKKGSVRHVMRLTADKQFVEVNSYYDFLNCK